jgi:hypothetical protein
MKILVLQKYLLVGMQVFQNGFFVAQAIEL